LVQTLYDDGSLMKHDRGVVQRLDETAIARAFVSVTARLDVRVEISVYYYYDTNSLGLSREDVV